MVEIFDVNKLHHKMKAHETPLRAWTDMGLKPAQVVMFGTFHYLAIYGLYMLLSGVVPMKTILLTAFIYFWSMISITAGAHRLWSHASYKPSFILELFLAICFSTTMGSIMKWATLHKIHHLYTETVADPYDARRGFWYSQICWLFLKPQPEVKLALEKHDHSRLENNPIVWFQSKFHVPIVFFMTFAFPSLLAGYGWGDFRGGFYVGGALRFIVCLHCQGLINSVAHMFGERPYDSEIYASENWMANVFAFGGGYHNYHHTFPQDYSSSEFGWSHNWNPTTLCIDFWVAIGLARNPTKVSTKKGRTRKTESY